MTREEIIYVLFGKQQESIIEQNLSEIKGVLGSQSNKAVIDVREIKLEDPKKKIDDPNYLMDEYLTFNENGIKILHTTDKVAEMLKPYIPTGVKELTIPSTFLKDLTFLRQFPNLETLNISDYSYFSPEEIAYISKYTTIKKLSLRSSRTFNDTECLPGFTIINGGNIIGRHGKLTMRYTNYNKKWQSYLNIYTSSYDEESISTIKDLYSLIKPELTDISSISISKQHSNTSDSDFKLDVSAGIIQKISIKNISPTEAARVYKSVLATTPVTKTEYSLENKTYDDVHYLKQMDKTSDLTIKYSNNESVQGFATYSEFIGMRETIDYYKELLESSNLSPVEKVAYVYDILKTMKYQENSEDNSRSRKIHSIVADGTIVCVGYSVFAKQLLNEVGIPCINVSISCLNEDNKEVGHQRNFVRVDDDKYNIHGLFAMDITWDSDKDISIVEENGQRIVTSRPNPQLTQIIDKYDNLVLYRHFLTPMDSYEIRYPNEINPTIYEIYKNGQVKDLIEEYKKVSSGEIRKSSVNNIFALEQHAELFSPSEELSTVENYLHATKPSLETFKEIIRNVRIAEGYQKEEATEDVERVVELHQMLREQNPNSPDNFFKSSQTK